MDLSETLHAERRVAGLTGMTIESARTFLGFVTGARWLGDLHREDLAVPAVEIEPAAAVEALALVPGH